MKNIYFYFLTVFIWGSTWLAIKPQLGDVPCEISIFYRFAIASTFLLCYCKAKKLSLSFKLKEHLRLMMLGCTLFSINYILFYHAAGYLVSGVASVVFSLASVFNILYAYFFFKTKPERLVIAGAGIGLVGSLIFFWEELSKLDLQSHTLLGLGLSVMGTLLFSLSSMISHRNQVQGIPLIPSTAIAMCYGMIFIFLYALFRGFSFVIPHNTLYWGSLFYLAIPGSIIAFLCYLSLVSRIGPERAGYATVFCPVIALVLSFFFENYRWTLSDIVGMIWIVVGNCLILKPKKIQQQEKI